MTSVIMLVNKFPPQPAGGAEKQAERLAEYLGQQGLHVGVLTRQAEGVPSSEQRTDFWVRRIAARGPGKLKPLTFALGAAAALIKRRREYDVLHAHLAFAPAVVAACVGQLLGKRVIVKFGNSGAYGDIQVSQRTMLGRAKLALFRRWVDTVIALDGDMEHEALAAGFRRERVRRMVNGIDTTLVQRCTDQSTAKAALDLADKTVLLFVGRLVPQKALSDLLIALQTAQHACPDLHLLMVGTGEERGRLENQVAALGLGASVSFVGNVENVQPYLDAADLFVLSSLVEGISNALLEAMASGVACIATAVGGTSEVLHHGACGVLVPPRQPAELADEIVRLAQQPDERMRLGAAARERIQTHYAFTVVGDQYIALYDQLLDRAKPALQGASEHL